MKSKQRIQYLKNNCIRHLNNIETNLKNIENLPAVKKLSTKDKNEFIERQTKYYEKEINYLKSLIEKYNKTLENM